MELSVKTLDSQTHNFKDLDEEITVSRFKSHISTVVALPPEQQRLIFRGRVLQDDKKLKDYNVTSGQVIHLVARNPANATPANDHPQPNSTAGNAGVRRNNPIIMGTIGTLVEFPDSNNPGANRNGPGPRHQNSAVVRLTVANESLTRASNLLQTLEEDITFFQEPEGEGDDTNSEHGEDSAMFDAIGRHHAATAAAVVASLHSGQITEPNVGTVPETHVRSSTPGNEGIPAAPTNVGRPEAPMIRELATSINDLVALNARLTPYLQTLQSWLVANADLGDAHTSVQYTYNTLSSILHSLSHSMHAISDITVDFSLPPGQRRLRAPTNIWIEQSPVIRATIPIGVHVGVDANGTIDGTGTVGGPQMQVVGGQGGLPAGSGLQIQQAITNLLQGVMSGQTQGQQQPRGGTTVTSETAPRNPEPANSNTTPRTTMNTNPILNLGSLFGQSGFQFSTSAEPVSQTSPRSNNISFNATAPQITRASSTSGQNVPASAAGTATHGMPVGVPQFSVQHSIMHHHGPGPRLENMILQCQSHHYSAALPTRPENLREFLTEQAVIPNPIERDGQVFENFLSILQGLNVIHPIINQYIRGYVLRGRDINNPGHVQTGVKAYARKIVEWIVASVSAYEVREFDAGGLTVRLNEEVTQLLTRITQVILTQSPGNSITPALGSFLNEWMPKILSVLESTFPAPSHLRILKGIVHLIVTKSFPGTSVVFTTQLTTAISEYLINCQMTPTEPEPEHLSSEMSMEIDVEIGDVIDNIVVGINADSSNSINGDNVGFEDTTYVPAPARRESEGSDDEDYENEYRSMTNDLFRNLPQAWHSTLLSDIQRQAPLRDLERQRETFSSGFLSLFPRK